MQRRSTKRRWCGLTVGLPSMDVPAPVGAYCRFSTLEQKRHGYGIDIQMRDVRTFAQRQGFSVRRFYTDKAQSGVAEERHALTRLLRDCHRGAIGTIVLPT